MATRGGAAKPPTQAQTSAVIATKTGLTKSQVDSVLAALQTETLESVRKHGEFNLLGLLKVRKVRKAATKARMGRNPRTGEEIRIGPKPATDAVRFRALKALRDGVL